MAIHNTVYDAANTAVRAFLTKVGAKYWGQTFNTGVGKSKTVWEEIKTQVFNGQCCYCGKKQDKLQLEHLVMFNREEYGLHHPGNVAPVCLSCNKRAKDENGKHLSWEQHLVQVCERFSETDQCKARRQRIFLHINDGEYAYPKLSANEKHSIRVIAETLYHSITAETENALALYGKITDAFVTSDK